MKHVVEAGTDAASLLLFDPGALPIDFDAKMKDDANEALRGLTNDGRAYWINTDGDGAYLLHAYVGEPVPEALREYAQDPIDIERFSVPTGTVYFSGAEYGFRDDPEMLKKFPHMGGCFHTASGFYRLRLFRTEYPHGLLEKKLRGSISAAAYQLHQGFGWLIWLVVVAWAVVAVAYFQANLDQWLRFWLPLAMLAPLIPLVVSRVPAYRGAQVTWTKIQNEFPSVVVEMQPTT